MSKYYCFYRLQGWKRFFTSTALPGNGGPLRQPRGQTSIFYKCAPELLLIEMSMLKPLQ